MIVNYEENGIPYNLEYLFELDVRDRTQVLYIIIGIIVILAFLSYITSGSRKEKVLPKIESKVRNLVK